MSDVFVVRYRSRLAMACALWLGAWTLLLAMAFCGGLKPLAAHGKVALGIAVVVVGAAVLAGPVFVWRYSLRASVAGEELWIDRGFGIRRSHFLRSDIVQASFRLNSGGYFFRISLKRGPPLDVEPWAQNFQRLVDHCGASAPSRIGICAEVMADAFVVRYRLLLAVACAVCLDAWWLAAMGLWKVWRLALGYGGGDLRTAAVTVALVGGLVVFGPALVWHYSLRVRVRGEDIRVDKGFGIQRRHFRRSDIAQAAFRLGTLGYVLWIGLKSGPSLNVEPNAHNFQRLVDYCGVTGPPLWRRGWNRRPDSR